jgi:hypothetical protein
VRLLVRASGARSPGFNGGFRFVTHFRLFAPYRKCGSEGNYFTPNAEASTRNSRAPNSGNNNPTKRPIVRDGIDVDVIYEETDCFVCPEARTR